MTRTVTRFAGASITFSVSIVPSLAALPLALS